MIRLNEVALYKHCFDPIKKFKSDLLSLRTSAELATINGI